MATTHEIPAESRSVEGKGASRRLRHSGKVPAIVYGSNQPPANIQLDHNTVWLASHNEWFYSAILDLALDGKKQKVLLRDMQRHRSSRSCCTWTSSASTRTRRSASACRCTS